jgi:hypothetical protein
MMLALLATILATTQAPPPPIASYVGPEVAAIVHVDLARLDLPAIAGPLVAKALDATQQPRADAAIAAAQAQLMALRAAGATDVYLLADPQAVPSIPAVVLLKPGGNVQAASQVLQAAQAIWPETRALAPGVLVAGTPQAIAQVEATVRAGAQRPEVVTALAETATAPVSITVVPGANQRRILDELMPTLPASLGGGPITALTRGLRHASLSLSEGPKPSIALAVQATDAASAEALLAILKKAQAAAPGVFGENGSLADFAKALTTLEPQAKGDRIELALSLDQAGDLVAAPIRAARDNAERMKSVNNLKQIGLAMHIYASEHKDTFPPAYSTSSEGKPLLSWRVLILPHLDQKPLFDQFHLDEPWDSPHNKPLIDKMPDIYAAPDGAKPGLTPYLVPQGADTIFPGAQAVGFRNISDGTSNTILAVDSGTDHQVTWTKPDDWEVPAVPKGQPLPGISAPWPIPFAALFADGSVRMLRPKGPTVLHALVTSKGGEVVDADAY